jgi:hypothetical protein
MTSTVPLTSHMQLACTPQSAVLPRLHMHALARYLPVGSTCNACLHLLCTCSYWLGIHLPNGGLGITPCSDSACYSSNAANATLATLYEAVDGSGNTHSYPISSPANGSIYTWWGHNGQYPEPELGSPCLMARMHNGVSRERKQVAFLGSSRDDMFTTSNFVYSSTQGAHWWDDATFVWCKDVAPGALYPVASMCSGSCLPGGCCSGRGFRGVTMPLSVYMSCRWCLALDARHCGHHA